MESKTDKRCQHSDRELKRAKITVQKKLSRYNHLRPDQKRMRKFMIRKIIPNSGINCSIYPPFYCDFGCNIHVGDNFSANTGCIILDVESITIGNNVMLGPHTTIAAAYHPIEADKRNRGLIYGKPVLIADNVWIGANCVINPGVKIGENSIVGAGSVVTHDIPANVVAAGNPCTILRKLDIEKGGESSDEAKDKHYYSCI